MDKRKIPLVCVLVALSLVGIATQLYGGGTLEDPTAVGFDWRRNYLTQLFRPLAVSGAANAARPYAIAGMWIFCVGIAELFRQLADRMMSTWHGKWVRIFGIAAMVYAALTVTRMHDLMVTIASVFTVLADVVLLDWLWRRRQMPQCIAGIATLALLLVASFIYQRQVAWAVLPTLQKLVFLCSVGWLFWIHKRRDVPLARSASA
jgi:hypothetical protein